jgi:RecB family exonuclease
LDIRLSYSAASAYEKCPLSYRFQYVDGLEIEPSPYLSFGRSMHSALEWLYGRGVPEPPALEELLAYLDSCWTSEGFGSPEEEDSFLRHGREILTKFYQTNLGDFRLPVAVEERFEMEMDGYVLAGVIDRVDRNPDGSYEIIDYKTNRRLPELNRLREDLQLPIYQMACRETWGISPSKLTFYYLVANQRYTTRPLDEGGLSRVRERLDRIAGCIVAGEFPPTPNRLCPWCSFEDICPERAPGKTGLERYVSRRRSLLRRKQGLEKVIYELEDEMRELGIPLNDGDDHIPGME